MQFFFGDAQSDVCLIGVAVALVFILCLTILVFPGSSEKVVVVAVASVVQGCFGGRVFRPGWTLVSCEYCRWALVRVCC